VHDAGIPTFIDRKPKIAHNKIVVMDQTMVVTGSFNFSTIAGCCNAENLLVIQRPELAVAYAENFARGGLSASSMRKRSRAQAARDRNRLGRGTVRHRSLLIPGNGQSPVQR
jgi:phosphatidylserine/phosphatidylglycerophosphate/cardiolipin synthase-like enzyme